MKIIISLKENKVESLDVVCKINLGENKIYIITKLLMNIFFFFLNEYFNFLEYLSIQIKQPENLYSEPSPLRASTIAASLYLGFFLAAHASRNPT
jgi:hypothetical protein